MFWNRLRKIVNRATHRRLSPRVEALESREVPSALGARIAHSMASEPRVPSAPSVATAAHPAVAGKNVVTTESAPEHYFFFAFQEIPSAAVKTIQKAQGKFATAFGDEVQINAAPGLHISVVRIGVIPDNRAKLYFNAATTYVGNFTAKFGNRHFHFHDKSGAKLVPKGSFVAYNAYTAQDSTEFTPFAKGLVQEIKAEIKRGNPSTLAAETNQPHISIFHLNDSVVEDVAAAMKSYNKNPNNPKLTFDYRPTKLFLMESLPNHQYRAVNSISL